MSGGVRALRKIQLGREAVAGTPVAATSIWRGIGVLEDQREVKFPAEDVGLLSGTDRTYVSKLAGAIAFESVEATFEQLLHILEAGIKDVGTGGADGVGTGKIYEYPFPTSAIPDVKTYTIEGGDNQESEVMEFCFVNDFTLAGKGGEAWMVDANWIGRQVDVQAFTGALVIPAVEEILFGGTKFYINNVASAPGTTLVSNTVLEARLKYTSGIIPRFATGEGDLFFTHLHNTMPEAVLELTFEHNDSGAAEKANWRDQLPRVIRLLTEGSALATAGTAYSKKTLIIDLAGKWEKFDKLGEQDGADVIQGTFRARYNATAALFGSILVVTELSTVP